MKNIEKLDNVDYLKTVISLLQAREGISQSLQIFQSEIEKIKQQSESENFLLEKLAKISVEENPEKEALNDVKNEKSKTEKMSQEVESKE